MSYVFPGRSGNQQTIDIRRARMAALTVAVVFASCLMLPSSPVRAQSSIATGSYVEVEDDNKTVDRLSMTVAQLDGMDIFYETRKIAKVDEVLADPSGNIVAVAVKFGTFFGLGGKEVVMPLDQLTAREGYLTSAISSEQLESLPAWQ